MADYTLSYTGQQIDALLQKVDNFLNNVYPIGSIYMSVNSTDPGTLFGGTWVQIQDTFLLAAGSTYTAGGTGGSAAHTHAYAHTHTTPTTTTGSHTLTTAEIPAHTHGSKTLTGTMNPLAWTASASESGIISGSQNHTDRVGNAGSNWGDRKYTINATHEHSSVGGGGGHTHDQVTTTTDSQSTSTTSETSNLPPYLTVYVWKRTA